MIDESKDHPSWRQDGLQPLHTSMRRAAATLERIAERLPGSPGRTLILHHARHAREARRSWNHAADHMARALDILEEELR